MSVYPCDWLGRIEASLQDVGAQIRQDNNANAGYA